MAAAAPALARRPSGKPGKVQYIDPRSPSFVIDESKNGRAEPYRREDLTDLINDIVARAKRDLPPIIQPISARLKGKSVEVAAGFGRSIAARIINEEGLTKAPVLVPYIVTDMNEYEAFLTNLSENLRRRNTTAVDDALNVRRLQTIYAKSDDEILQIYAIDGKKRSEAWLRQTRKILNLEPDEQHEYRLKRIAADTAYILSDIPDPKVRREVMQEATEEAIREAEADLPVPVEMAKEIIQEATAGRSLPVDKVEQQVMEAAKKRGVKAKVAKKVARAAKKIVNARPERRHVEKAIATKTGQDCRARKMPEVRDFFGKFCGPGAEPESLRNFSKLFSDWMDGKNGVTTKKAEAAYEAIFHATRKATKGAAPAKSHRGVKRVQAR